MKRQKTNIYNLKSQGKFKRKKRRRVNLKRFIISMSIICVVFIMFLYGTYKGVSAIIRPHNKIDAQKIEKINSQKDLDNEKRNLGLDPVSVQEVNIKKILIEKDAINWQELSKKDFKTFFKGDVFLGDSITDALGFFGIIQKKSVVSSIGVTLHKAQKNLVPLIAQKKPKRIFVLLGVNDMDEYVTDKIFKERYLKLITLLKQKSPNSKIYIESILPVDDKVTKKVVNSNIARPNNEKIEKFNEVLKEVAQESGCYYLDLNKNLKIHTEGMYLKDGIHFKKEFHYLWLDLIQKEIIKN